MTSISKKSLHLLTVIFVLIYITSFENASATSSEQPPLSREKRGASVYPVFMGSGGHGSAASPPSFMQYLSGSSGGGGYSSNSPAPAASMTAYYLALASGAGGGHGGGGSSSYGSGSSSSGSGSGGSYAGTAFDMNHLNSYMMSGSGGSSSSSSSSPSSSSGWSPSGSLGYGGSFYTNDFGHLSPNFAHTTMPVAQPPSSTGQMHTLSATSLAHSAQTSFQAQNSLYDVYLSGSRPQTYKGSSSYKKRK